MKPSISFDLGVLMKSMAALLRGFVRAQNTPILLHRISAVLDAPICMHLFVACTDHCVFGKTVAVSMRPKLNYDT